MNSPLMEVYEEMLGNAYPDATRSQLEEAAKRLVGYYLTGGIQDASSAEAVGKDIEALMSLKSEPDQNAGEAASENSVG